MTLSSITHAFSQLPKREAIFLGLLLAFSITIRVVYHIEMRANPLVTNLQLDEQFHDQWAKAIAGGDWMGNEVFFRAPFYPYAVGVLYALTGNSPEVVRILQHVLGLLSVLLVYLTARSLFGFAAAATASLLAAGYSVMIYFEGRLLFDSLLTFMVLLWFAILLALPEKGTWRRYTFMGMLYGIICITRPTFLAAFPFLFALVYVNYLKHHDQKLPAAAALILATLLPVAAVTLRNGLVGGEYVVVASQGGINFYIGNNHEADGISAWVPELGDVWGQDREVQYAAERSLGRQLGPSEVSSYWYGKGLDFLLDQPLEFLKLQMKKAYLFWSRIEIANNLSYYWFERASLVLRLLPVGFWLVAPLAVAGMYLTRKNRSAQVLILFILLHWLLTSAFFISDRFRLPVVPILCIFAGTAVVQLWEGIRKEHWRGYAPAVLVLAIAALLVNSNFADITLDVSAGDDAIRGRGALEAGELHTAAELLRRASSIDPGNSSIRINLGAALWGLGKREEAAGEFRAALTGNPYLAQVNLAHLYFNSQHIDSALYYAQRAIQARPFAPGGYIIAAKAHLILQQQEQAEEMLHKGNAACREDFLYGEYLLAGLYFQKGELERADSLYRQVLLRSSTSRQPSYTIATAKEQFGEDLNTLTAKSQHAIGRVFAAYGKLDSSEVYFRRAARLLPMKPDIWADWGVCLMRLNRLAEADSVMRRVANLAPRNAAVWLNFATLRARMGDMQEAERAALQALSLRPDFREAQEFLRALRSYSQKR